MQRALTGGRYECAVARNEVGYRERDAGVSTDARGKGNWSPTKNNQPKLDVNSGVPQRWTLD